MWSRQFDRRMADMHYTDAGLHTPNVTLTVCDATLLTGRRRYSRHLMPCIDKFLTDWLAPALT